MYSTTFVSFHCFGNIQTRSQISWVVWIQYYLSALQYQAWYKETWNHLNSQPLIKKKGALQRPMILHFVSASPPPHVLTLMGMNRKWHVWRGRVRQTYCSGSLFQLQSDSGERGCFNCMWRPFWLWGLEPVKTHLGEVRQWVGNIASILCFTCLNAATSPAERETYESKQTRSCALRHAGAFESGNLTSVFNPLMLALCIREENISA